MTVFAHEIYLSLVILVFFLFSISGVKGDLPRKAALLLSLGALLSAIMAFGAHGDLFSHTYRVDAFSQSFKLLVALGFFLAVAFGEGLRGVEEEHGGDYFIFLSMGILGLTLLSSAVELLTLYIALELSSYSLYILVPMRKKEHGRNIEAAIKYVLFGAAASGLSLFGMSYVFGLAQTTRIDKLLEIYPAIAASPMGLVALSMMFAGFFFKLALFPFHFWTPDIYEGSANETGGVIATLPKIGAVAVMIRLTGMGDSVAGFGGLLALLAIFSMTYGNLAALLQTDLKRLLAFSSISHAGFVTAGILTGSVTGYAGAMYYIGGYLLMNLALFLVIYELSPDGRNVVMADLKGLYRRSPALAFTLAVGAFGLAGIPPTAGFAGKFFVLTAAFDKGYTWLVILGAINTAISIFYYLKMVRAAYSPEENEVPYDANDRVESTLLAKTLAIAFSVSILAAGSFPGAIIDIFRNALSWVS